MWARLLVLLAMLAYAAAGPVRLMTDPSDSCATTCKPPSKFQYSTGRTYKYDYTVQTETSMAGASEERAAISISGQADIEVIDQCDLALVLRNIQIHESGPAEDSSGLRRSPQSQELSRLLQTPLRFSFQDGVVAELCPSRQEDPWALNIKRGVLSAFQNSMDQLQGSQTVQESDVTGTCETVYEVTASSYWSATTVKRRKDLMTCTERHGYSGSLQSAHYQTDSGLQSLPLMESEHECEQQVSRGILQSITCSERHLFRPFSSERSGAVTTVMQQLTFRTQTSGVSSRKDWVDSRAEMTFDHGYSVRDSSEARARTAELLSALCDATIRGVQPEAPRLFSQLVGAVKKLDRSDIRDILDQLRSQEICSSNNERTKKFFLDALPMAGSEATVELMKDLMVSGDVSGMEADLWLGSLAFIPEPTAEMIVSVQDLLESESLKLRAMLAVSSMVNNHCQKMGCSSRAVDSIMSSLESIIGYRCAVNDGNIKTILTTLRAIGNTGQARAVNVISRCLNYRKPIEVRVAAAEAFRRMPCDADKQNLIDILRDSSEDTEIRVTAYVQIMTCPTRAVLTDMQVIMESEPEDSQVGAFMYSHLTNLMETSSPLKQDIKQLVQDLQLNRLFEANPIKFSRNYEKSAFLRSLNLGGQVESNVIFSSQSPVPRSVSANLTVDLFGHSVNLLELGARLEGVEYLIETLQLDFSGNSKDKSARRKLDELKGSGYARVFGNELLYNRFQGISTLTSGKGFNVLDFLIKMSKDHDYSFTQSLQFLDSTMTVPTACGLPLTLSVNGTSVVDVKATGKVDLRKVSKTPRTLEVEGKIRNSGAVNVDAVMSVDALLTRSGLKVSSSLHSSLAVKGHVQLDRGQLLSVQMDVPDDRMEILNVNSKFFILHNKKEVEQKMITDNRKEFQECTGSTVAKVTGLELCADLQFPNASMQSSGPYFPLTGPSSVSVVLHKRDSLTGYKLMAKRVENKRNSIAQLSFDTPGSRVVRAMSFDMMINYPQKDVEISFASPWKKASVKGSVVNDAGLKSLTGSVVVDDDQTYSLTSEVKVDDQSNRRMTVFTPMVEIRRPGADTVTVMGSVQVDSRSAFKQLNADLTLNGATKKPLRFQSTYANLPTEKSVTGTISYGKISYSAQAGVTYNVRTGKNAMAQFNPRVLISTPRGDVLNLGGSTNYRQGKVFRSEHTLTIPGVLAKPINFKCDITKKGRRNGVKVPIEFRIKSRPFTGTARGVITLGNVPSAQLTITYNVLRGSRDHVTINGKISDKSTGTLQKRTLVSSVEFRRNSDWNVDANVDFENKRKRSMGKLRMTLGKDPKDKSKQVLLSASLDRTITDWTNVNMDYKMRALAPMLGMDYAVNGDHSHSPDSLASSMNVKYGKGKVVKAEVNLKDKSTKQVKINGDASLSFPGHLYEMATVLKKNGKQYVSTVNMKTHKGQLVDLTGTYKPARDNTHEVTADLDLDGVKPIKASASAGLQWDNLQLQGQLLHGRDTYSANAMSKISRGNRGKWTAEVSYPTRTLAFSAIGGRQKNTLDIDVSAEWDKNRDDSAKVTASVSGTHKTTRDITSSSGKVEVITPFQFLDRLSASVSFDNDRQRYGLDGKLKLGAKSGAYHSTLDVRKPVSPANVQLTWLAESPVRGLKRLQASVDHKADSRSLSTELKASKGNSGVTVTVTANDNSVGFSKDLSGGVTVQSDMRGMENVVISASHKEEGDKYATAGSVSLNDDRYAAQLDMSHSRRDWRVRNNGNLQITSPRYNIANSWQHRSSSDDVKTTLTSSWGRGKQLQVDISGNKELTDSDHKVNSALTITSPWRQIRDLSVTLSHEMSGSHLSHQSSVVHNEQKKVSAQLNYQLNEGDVSGDFAVSAPYMHDKSGSMRASYSSFPATAHVEMLMAPRRAITGDASFTKTGVLDVEGNVRLTTPFQALRTVTISASNQLDGPDTLTKANLDYGVRQNYDLEVRIRRHNLGLARVKIDTPHDQFSSLDVGYQVDGNADDFDATADLTLQPLLGKYSALVNWQHDEDVSGKLRVDMPLQDLRYVQLTVGSDNTPKGRKSRLELDYHPRQIYALSSFYAADSPLIFSLHVDTPIRNYDSFGVSVRHELGDGTLKSHGEVQYPQDQVIDATLNLAWRRNIDGSLVVKTPFASFEESKVSVRHDGQWDDFNSHAEAEVMQETMVADVQFKHGITTSGSFSLESSLDMQKVEASFNKRGSLDNFRSSASAAYGGQKVEGTLNHKLNSRVLKTTATFASPFTRNIKSSVELSNKNGDMAATISGQYGPKKVESKSTLVLDNSDIQASSALSHNLNGADEEMTGAVTKRGGMNNLDLTATFSSPYTEDASVSMQHRCDLPRSLSNDLSARYGSDYSIKSVNSFRRGSRSLVASSTNTFQVGGPEHEAVASFNIEGELKALSVSTLAKYDDKQVQASGEFKSQDGINANLQVSTPFDNYQRLSLDFVHTPSAQGFQQEGSLTYMADQTIRHTVTFSNVDLRDLSLDAMVTSPIQGLERNSLKVRHTYSRDTKQCTGLAEVSSALGDYGLNYKREGDWDQMTLEGSLDLDGEELKGDMKWLPLTHGYKASLELSSPLETLTTSAEMQKSDDMVSFKGIYSLPPASLHIEGDASVVGFNAELNSKISVKTAMIDNTALMVGLKKTGPLNDVTLQMDAGINSKKTVAVAKFKNAADEVSGSLDVNTPFRSYSDIGGSFKHSGDLNRFSSEASVRYQDDQQIVGKTTFYRYQWRRVEATAELTTPFSGLTSTKAEYRHAGSADSFTCSSSLQYGDQAKVIASDLRASLSPKYDATLTLRTPFAGYSRLVADAKLETLGNTHTASSSLDLGGGQRYAVDGNLDMDSVPMTFTSKLTSPVESLRSVELSGSHQGQLDDFSSSLVLNFPQTGVINVDTMLRFSSIFDVNAAASLSSSLAGAEDLRVEVRNSDTGNSKSGHVLARWAPRQEVAVDGTYVLKDYWYNKELQAEVTLTTPFQAVRSANVHVQHEQKDETHKPKVEFTLNGDKLFDVESEVLLGDSPSASLTSRKPWPAQLTASLATNGDTKEGEVFVNWNRDESGKNVRVQTKAKNVQDGNQIDIDYSVKIIRPSRTVSSGVTLQKQAKQVISEGYVSLDDRADRKIFYVVELNDRSEYYRKMYDATVKMGIPARTLEGTASYSSGHQTSAVDTSFSWDAGRDDSKQVGFKGKLTSGDKTKADVTFHLPAIGKEVHIDHEMALNQGRTVWDGKTELSYSTDSSKTLTLASSIKDVSDSFSSGQNYTLTVAISHPHTNTDIGFTSHLGATGDRYSAAMDTVYLTSRRQRKNVALRGEIDRLRREIDFQLVSPVKKVAVHGQVESTEPCVIKLINTYDDDDVIQSVLNIDPDRRSIKFSTNYDLDNPDKQLVLEAGYVNSTAVRAELSRQQDDTKISDGVLAVRLNTSTLLHTRLAWRPQIFSDFQEYIRQKTVSQSDDLRQVLGSLAAATGQELSDKYAAIAEELRSEVSPVLDLVQGELIRLGEQMDRARRVLTRMYRRNDLHLQDLEQYTLQIIEVMRDYTEAYRTVYSYILGDVRANLNNMANYNIRQQYDDLIEEIREKIALMLPSGIEFMDNLVARLDEQLTAWRARAQDGLQAVKDHPSVQHVTQRVRRLGQDYKWLMGYTASRLQQLSVPEQYTSAIYGARDTIANRLSDVMNNRHVDKAKAVANEVYQQGAWAYRYWNVEKNTRENIIRLGRLIGEVIEDEFHKLTEKLQFLRKSRVTVYDPEDGQIQVELVLPVPVRTLQEKPDISDYVKSYNNVMDRYVMHYYNQYAPWLSNETTPANIDVMSQFETYQPSINRETRFSRRRRVSGM